jgi:hypothetical protein
VSALEEATTELVAALDAVHDRDQDVRDARLTLDYALDRLAHARAAWHQAKHDQDKADRMASFGGGA